MLDVIIQNDLLLASPRFCSKSRPQFEVMFTITVCGEFRRCSPSMQWFRAMVQSFAPLPIDHRCLPFPSFEIIS